MKEGISMLQEVLTVFEDRKQRVDLSQIQIHDILSFRSILGNQCVHLDYDGSLQIMHYVGFIAKGKTRLQILPKIYEKTGINSKEEIRESMQVLFNLLRASEYNQVLHLPESQDNSLAQTDLLEIFIAIFADRIFKTYSSKMNREYIEIEENSPFIKGKINFSKTIKHNWMRKDLHYVNYQSFEHDNLINNIIKTVAVQLLEHTQNSDNKKSLKRALMFLVDAREVQLSLPLIDSVKFTRLNMEFKPVFNMAKMFYLNLQPENFSGKESVFSFLIPVNDLYEYYLYKLFNGIEGYHAKHEAALLFAKTDDDRNMLTIKPDILVYQNQKLTLITDAKYKNPCFEKDIYTNISRDDIYQIFAYAKVYGIKKVALIYPLFDNIQVPRKKIILKDYFGEIELNIVCVDIKNPDIDGVRKQLKTDLL